MLSINPAGDGFREDIVQSWLRSSVSGVRADQLRPPYDPSVDADCRLLRAARPVLQRLADDLGDASMSLILTDERGRILERHVGDHGLRCWLDLIDVAPGFVYGEDQVGTNAIGTALVLGRPVWVLAGEHFVTVLNTMACAAVPVTDPLTGDVLGAVDISCRAEDTETLMMPFVKNAAGQIRRLLFEPMGRPGERGRRTTQPDP
jgi:transcriptional regulator of acetoin/glycerol metabolism